MKKAPVDFYYLEHPPGPDFVTQSFLDGLEMRSSGIGYAVHYLDRKALIGRAAYNFWVDEKRRLQDQRWDCQKLKYKEAHENRTQKEDLTTKTIGRAVRNIRTSLSQGQDALVEE